MIEPRRATHAGGSRIGARDRVTSAFRRSLGLTALGTLIPGAGLTQTKRRALGWSILAAAVAVLGVIVYFVFTRGVKDFALQLASRPGLLLWLTVGLGLAALVWIVSIISTSALTRPRRLDAARSRVLTAFTALMVILVTLVSFRAGQYLLITKDTVEDVFQADSSGKAGPGAKIADGEDPWKDTPRVNLLLLGSDAGTNRDGTRTDSMVVASVDTKTGNTVLISLPRNLERAPIPASSELRKLYPSGIFGRPECFNGGQHECLLAYVWMQVDNYRTEHPGTFLGDNAPGRTATREVIQEVTGLKIDHTVVIDMSGFERLVDAMGGVTINVKTTASGGKVPIGGKVVNGQVVGVKDYFTPGVQHLDGYHALWYARSRAGDSDDQRQERQRCTIKALVGQVNPGVMVTRYADVAQIARDSIYTDIPSQNLQAFVMLVERIQKGKITSVSLTQKDGVMAGNPDYDLVRQLIQDKINPPAPTSNPETSPTTKEPTSSRTTESNNGSGSSGTTTAPVDECA